MVPAQKMGPGLDTPPREHSRTERRLKVVPADWTVQIENLAGEVKAGHDFAFHRVAIDFIECNAACSDLGLGEPTGACDPNFGALDRSHKRCTSSLRKFGS